MRINIRTTKLLKIMMLLIKLVCIALAIFLISVIIINIIRPLGRKNISKDYCESVLETDYYCDEAGTERILCIDNNEDALLWRLRMIGNAKESIIMTTFDLRMDDRGLDIVSALCNAADRGVKVKILIDGIYEPIFLHGNSTFYALCNHKNIEVRMYNPIKLKNIYNANYRMHDKYLMVDECMYMLGGRNTSNIFLGEMNAASNVDRDLLVYNSSPGKGESFLQLESYFEQIWTENRVSKVLKNMEEDILQEEYEQLASRYMALSDEHEDFSKFGDWYDSTLEADKITLISNGTAPANKEPRVLYTIGELADNADEVIIQTPYIICDKYMYSVLRDIEKHADLKIMINSVEKGSNPWGCTDYLNNKSKVLHTGADVYELMNDYALHTKTVLIDDTISIIGSYNLDMRSTYIDTELMLVVDSEQLNASIREEFEQYKEKSVEVLSDGKETTGSLYQEKEMTTAKKIIYDILRVIIIPFRHLL